MINVSDRAEEILEALWTECVELKKKTCDAHLLKDDTGVKELADAELVVLGHDKKITLTARGEEEAKNCVRRHRLAERLFVDILDVKKKIVHETSCKFEHLLHKGLDNAICTLLGHPKTCPHGKPIPEGSCCRDARQASQRLIMPLSDLAERRRAQVAYLQTKDRAALQKILAIGVLPQTEIRLVQKFPSYVFQIGKSQFAIDKELASQIYVRIR